jgi:hypothetical protein
VFIAAVFGAYGAVQTGNSPRIRETIPYIELYLVLLGIIVSVAWLLVSKGSKFWQENWEAHIDRLEDAITGPLHKTVYTKGKNAFSVSKINEMLAWVVIVVWGLLLYNFFANWNFIRTWHQLVYIVLAALCIVVCNIIMRRIGRSSDGQYEIDTEQYSKGVFVDRTSDNCDTAKSANAK